MPLNRRRFLTASAAAAAGLYVESRRIRCTAAAAAASEGLHIATNVYPWLTFYRRDNLDFQASLDEGLAQVARSGVNGWEPIINRPEEVQTLGVLLKKHGLEMRSFYVNSQLHEAALVNESIQSIVDIARRARELGSQIVVTNPSPIRWGGPENKSDQQLRTQAAALNQLGERLKDLSLTLAYHNHDMEMRCSAREFHHMMLGTDPALVTLCLDAHWVYRGAENSSVALFDIVHLYLNRVTELHLRQSVDHVWTESFGEGDIDYGRLVELLCKAGLQPHLVLEQAVEPTSTQTMDAVEAHRGSVNYARHLLAPLTG